MKLPQLNLTVDYSKKNLKWPELLVLIRHAPSLYNFMKEQRKKTPLYKRFKDAFEKNPESKETVRLAHEVANTWKLGVGDWNTPLAPGGEEMAIETGKNLRRLIPSLDVIIYSPYERAVHTMDGLIKGFPELAHTKKYREERVRELDHGKLTQYNDRRVYFAIHPEERRQYEIDGEYYYSYKENIPDLRLRVHSEIGTIVREFSGMRVGIVTHHLVILALCGNLLRWDDKEFIQKDKEEKPINCGVTIFKGVPGAGDNGQGKLLLVKYNLKLYEDH